MNAMPSLASGTGACGLSAIQKYKSISAAFACGRDAGAYQAHLPSPLEQRRAASLQDAPYDLVGTQKYKQSGGGPDLPDTILYLAYGSNLCAETFQGKRGIRPLSQVNVVVPELVMTFDLAGLPYVEPCFANTRYRTTEPAPLPPSEKTSLQSAPPPAYHKTRWKKGLVGVVYEVTKEDFAHIMATEGGGASYQDVPVQCYEIPQNQDTVPEHPTTAPFKAHTLYSPVFPPGEKPPPQEGGRFSRPDPHYAQPSARYLKLIHDGADEHGLPEEYKTYLHQLRAYTVTTRKQEIGRAIFTMVWLPLVTMVFGLNRRFADEAGRAPAWLVAVTGAAFKGMWVSYDGGFYRVFGDGDVGVDVERRSLTRFSRGGHEKVEDSHQAV